MWDFLSNISGNRGDTWSWEDQRAHHIHLWYHLSIDKLLTAVFNIKARRLQSAANQPDVEQDTTAIWTEFGNGTREWSFFRSRHWDEYQIIHWRSGTLTIVRNATQWLRANYIICRLSENIVVPVIVSHPCTTPVFLPLCMKYVGAKYVLLIIQQSVVDLMGVTDFPTFQIYLDIILADQLVKPDIEEW